MTLIGLVPHAAEVERNWFRRVLAGEDLPSLSGEPKSAEGHDGGFALRDGVTLTGALAAWRDEIAVSRPNCTGRDPDRTSPFAGGDVTLRWIYAHMIGEYPRHVGHADLPRERIDGRTGV